LYITVGVNDLPCAGGIKNAVNTAVLMIVVVVFLRNVMYVVAVVGFGKQELYGLQCY